MDTFRETVLALLRTGKFHKALLMADGNDLEYHAENSYGKWIVCDAQGSVLYDADSAIEDEYEARILALWHSLDDDATFYDIVIVGMGKQYINGVRVK